MTPIPISALQHVVYCPRQAALIHLERAWAENRFTAEGAVLHAASDQAGRRRARRVRRVNALPIASARLGVAGVADLVELHAEGARERPFPIEIKRGKPKQHRADEVQLCAQALCLEEMTGATVPEGAIFYAETKRRLVVAFDDALRAETDAAIATLRDMFASGRTPTATYRADRCRACSLIDVCRPKVIGRSVIAWRKRMLAGLSLREPGP